ncbi:MAG: hypothetical protein HY892_16250 [Deltaproteobacteria bacterium]|nr:hypothetical protein [Deltaproteobacteria bacterium]
MILLFIILLPLFLLVLWGFFRFQPRGAGRSKLMVYNGLSILTAVLLSGGYAWHLYRAMAPTSDFAWWPVIAPIFALGISTGLLILAGLLRLVFFPRSYYRNSL